MKDWGIDRDGADGLIAYLVGIGVEVFFIVVAVATGIIATRALIGWLVDLSGR